MKTSLIVRAKEGKPKSDHGRRQLPGLMSGESGICRDGGSGGVATIVVFVGGVQSGGGGSGGRDDGQARNAGGGQ